MPEKNPTIKRQSKLKEGMFRGMSKDRYVEETNSFFFLVKSSTAYQSKIAGYLVNTMVAQNRSRTILDEITFPYKIQSCSLNVF